jgi:cation diffusion facilitator CzcD-associated flavoprotein CzcO
MPYLKFPDNWPVFTPKDKLAEWFEIYVKAMELSVWTSTSLSNSRYDPSSQMWSVTLTRTVGGREVVRVLHPKHIIQATGHASEKNFPAHIKGIPDFKGDVLCHSSEFPGAKAEGKGKNAVVVGCCNSGHDIAQDFVSITRFGNKSVRPVESNAFLV